VGEVVGLDDQAASRWGVSVGDRVVSEQIVPCWNCRYCRRGEYWLCEPHVVYGFKRHRPGGMASYMIVPAEAIVYKIATSLDPAHAAFTEPLACGLHAVERANIRFDDVVVVAGCGPIGLGMVAGAAAKTPRAVIALDMSSARLEIASLCGATRTIDITKEDPVDTVKALTDGFGADVYLEATGHPAAVTQGLNILRKRGTFVEYGVFASDVVADWSIISDDKELTVLGAHLGPHCWPSAINMIESRRLPLDRICTHQLPLEQFQAGLDLVGDGTRSIKVSLIPA
jgi:threonine dehydrogenase-like Zn-dependent dehydrogenase